MKICVLSDAYEGSESPLVEVDQVCDPSPYLPGHECEHVFLRKATAVRDLIQLARRDYDVFFNLCDGAWDEGLLARASTHELDRLVGVALTVLSNEARAR